MNQLGLQLALVVCVSLVGCSGDAGDPNLRRTAEQHLEAGRQALDRGEYDAALGQFEQATAGGLNADQYSEALVYKAVSAIHLGQYDVAEQAFEVLDQGATNLDQVLAAKSFLAASRGNRAEAQSLLAQARRLNPKIAAFK